MKDVQNMSPREALEALGMSDPGTREQSTLAFALRQKVDKDADFAEGVVEEGGLHTILDVMKGAGQATGYFLDVICGLLLYTTGLEQLLVQPDIVERIWKLVVEHDANGDAVIRVARPAVQILIITIKFLGQQGDDASSWINEDPDKKIPITGRKIVHRAAKKLVKDGIKSYEGLCSLLNTKELNLQTNVLGLLVILVQKSMAESRYKAKKLLFMWHQCGLLTKVDAMNSGTVDETLSRLLKTFKQLRDTVKIPQCWIASTRNCQMFEKEKHAYDQVNSEVFLHQQQIGRIREARAQILKSQEAARSLSLQCGTSPNYHPTARFSEGGGITLPTPGSPVPKHILQATHSIQTADLSLIRGKAFDNYKNAVDLSSFIEKVAGNTEEVQKGPVKGSGKTKGARFDDDTTESEASSEDLPPPSDESSDSTSDSDSESLPPPSEEDSSDSEPPPDPQQPGGGGGGGAKAGAGPTPSGTQPIGGPTEFDPVTGAPVVEPAATGGGGGGPGVAPPPPPPPTTGGTGAPVAPPAVGAKGKKTVPPPPGKGKGKKGAAGPKVQWWKHGKPKQALRVFHWEKVQVGDEKASGTIWGKVHFEYDCSFDLEDFVKNFQAKAAGAKKPKGPTKPEKIEMMDSKKFQNISIMLHKMPAIEDIKRGLDLLNTDVLPRDCLESLKAQIPNEEEEEMFVSKIAEKEARGEEWEKPESFFMMIYQYNSAIFRKRAESWLFSLDWGEMIVNIEKPLHKLQTAIQSVLDSDSLTFVMGILLGFGNTMNAGTAKGNAGAFSPKTLTQLEAARDRSGKVNLLQHLVHCVKKQREECLALPNELKTTLKGVHVIKYEDLDKAFTDSQSALKKFTTQSKAVVQFLEKNGAGSDPYISIMETFKQTAEGQLESLQAECSKMKEDFISILRLWSAPKKVIDKPQPEEFFGALVPFLEKFKTEADTIQKEQSKKKGNTGKKITGKKDDIDAIVGSITEGIVAS